MRLGSLLALLVFAVVISCVAEARAEPQAPGSPVSDPAARSEYEHALALYQHGEYAAAIGPLRRAYELYPSPELLYDLAQAQRLAGDCTGALASYRAFLATDPSEPLRSRADAKLLEMEQCAARVADSAGPPESNEAAPSGEPPRPAPEIHLMPAPPPAAAPAVTHGSPTDRRKPYVIALAAVSLAGFAVSGAAFVSYSSKNHEAEALCPNSPPDGCSEGDTVRHNELVHQARTARTWTYAGFGTGLVAGAASLALAFFPRRDPRATSSRWSLQADAGGGFVRLGLSSTW